MVLSRCRPICPGFTTVKPGSISVHPGGVSGSHRLRPGDCRSRHGYAPVFAGIENDSNVVEPGRHRGEPEHHQVKRGSPWQVLRPVFPGGVPVHPGGVPVKPDAVPVHPGPVLVTHGLLWIIPVCHGRVPVLSRFVILSPLFYPVFDISHGSTRLY